MTANKTNIKYETKKVVRKWKEIHVSAEQFTKIPEDDFDKFQDDYYPSLTLVFEGGARNNDELFYYSDGKVRLSSFNSGLVEWCDKTNQYVSMYHGGISPLGQLLSVEFIYSKELNSFLKKHLDKH